MIRPVYERQQKISVGLPKAKLPLKKGFSFSSLARLFSLRSKRPPAIPSPHAPYGEPSPPRHYSLLEPSETREPKHPEKPVEVPTISSVRHETARPIFPQPAAAEEGAPSILHVGSHRAGRGLPWWLDIFSLIARLSPLRPGRRSRKPRLIPTSREAFSEAAERVRRETPPLHPSVPKLPSPDERMSRVHTALMTPGTMPGTEPTERIRRQKRGLSLPKWLDIFFWLRTASTRDRHREKPVPAAHAMPPIPRADGRSERRELPSGATPRASAMPQIPMPHTPIFTPRNAGEPRKPHVKEKRPRRQWRLPKWIDIFYWLSWLKGPARIVREAQRVPVMSAPEPRAVTPVVPHVPAAPAPFRVQEVREAPIPPKPPAPPITPPRPPVDARFVLRPEQQRVPERFTPEAGLHSAGVTPSAAPEAKKEPMPRRFDGIIPIADVSETKPEKSRKPHDDLRKFFHIPGKTHLPDETRAAREVNLIPGDLMVRNWAKLGQLLGLACVGTLVFVAIIYGILYFWKLQIETRTALIDREIQKFKDDILVYRSQEPEMTAIGRKVDLVNALLGQHIYWTNFFSLLEKYTLPDVYYSGLSATTNGTLSLAAQGSGFETVSRLVRLLNSDEAKEFVTEATIYGAQRITTSDEESRVQFTLELTLNPDLFYYHGGS